MRINKALLAAALGYALAHQEADRPRRHAYTVWDRLIAAMNADNGCTFEPTEAQKEEAIPHILRMMRSGFFQDDPDFLKGSYWMMAAGEAFEKIHFFHNCDGYMELDRILEDVFNGRIKE